MHARRRGVSGSKKPDVKGRPEWVTQSAGEVEELVVKLAKDGKDPARIGLILRDQYAIPSVRSITDKSIAQIMNQNGLIPKLPYDLQNLMRRAVELNEHLKKNSRDLHNRRGLQLIESKIRRLVKYYSSEGLLPDGWKYSLDSAKLEIE